MTGSGLLPGLQPGACGAVGDRSEDAEEAPRLATGAPSIIES
jgi:hypothetical protein